MHIPMKSAKEKVSVILMKGERRRELLKVKQKVAELGAVGSLSHDGTILRLLPLCRGQADGATSAATGRQIADVHTSEKSV